MSAAALVESLAALREGLPQLEEALKMQNVMRELDAGAIDKRPWSFRHPLKGETDPWFGLAYQDWLEMRREGFTGTYVAGGLDSKRPKIMIVYHLAVEWLSRKVATHGPRLSARVAGSVLASDEERGAA